MAKTRRQLPIRASDETSLVITTTAAIVFHLERLAETGLFGRTPEEVADRLLGRAIAEMMERGSAVLPYVKPVWMETVDDDAEG